LFDVAENLVVKLVLHRLSRFIKAAPYAFSASRWAITDGFDFFAQPKIVIDHSIAVDVRIFGFFSVVGGCSIVDEFTS